MNSKMATYQKLVSKVKPRKPDKATTAYAARSTPFRERKRNPYDATDTATWTNITSATAIRVSRVTSGKDINSGEKTKAKGMMKVVSAILIASFAVLRKVASPNFAAARTLTATGGVSVENTAK